MSPEGSKAIVRPGWTIDMRSTALVVIALVLVAALFVLLYRGSSRNAAWPLAKGIVEDTRIVPDHALETKWGGEVTWKAEYKVAYFVGSHEFAVWTHSGIRGESEAAVRLALPQSRPSCQVQYNPQRPEISVANICRRLSIKTEWGSVTVETSR